MIITETKVCGDRAKRIADRLPLDGAIFANPIGLSGGLWVLWDSNQVEISELSSTEQEIHVVVSTTANAPWLLFAVYASPRFAERRLLWDNLAMVVGLHSMPWVIAGDFNEALMGDDKFGGNSVNTSRALRFQDCLDSCKMIDIGFAAAVLHMEKGHSDHYPIKLCLDNRHNFRPSRPFRFQPMWLSHPSFPGVVREAWTNPPSIQFAISSFTEKATSWNRSHFGNLFQRKRRVIARLKGIQMSLSIRPNNYLIDLERELRSELLDVTKLEEEFWAMKAHILWLVEGDRSTSFFHTSALVRKRRNHILYMQDSMGNWLDGDREIADFIRKGFSTLFSTGLNCAPLTDWSPPFWQTYLKEEEARHLDRPISDEEITAGLWALKPFEALGVDSLHAGFF
nr:uncharacterized protein LOC111992798 [Quercus suber]